MANVYQKPGPSFFGSAAAPSFMGMPGGGTGFGSSGLPAQAMLGFGGGGAGGLGRGRHPGLAAGGGYVTGYGLGGRRPNYRRPRGGRPLMFNPYL